MAPDLQYGGAATIGARRRQEDAWGARLLPPDDDGVRLLALVADGLGGHPAGDEASRIVCRAFLEAGRSGGSGSPRECLRHALEAANRQVREAVETSPELAGMGTTLVAVLFHTGGCDWLSVGDSFLFHYRDGRMRRVNPLHTVGAELDEMARRGEITAAEAASHPERPLITSVIQGGPIDEVAEGGLPLETGDVVILATDGVETLGEDGIASACGRHAADGAEDIARAMTRRIERIGSWNQDNATVVVVREPP